MADVCPALAQSDASPLPSFDFRQAGAVAGWGEPRNVTHIEARKQGMAVHTVKAWSPQPSFVVIHGLHPGPASKAPPVVRLDGQPITLDPPHQYLPDRGTLILEVQGVNRLPWRSRD